MVRRKEPGDWDPFDGWPFSFDPAGMMEEMRKMMRNIETGGAMSRSYGYRMTVGPDGERRIEVFGDTPDGLLPAEPTGHRTVQPGTPDGIDDGPVSDVMECGGSFVVTVEMPGVSDDEIDIAVDGNEMNVKAAHGQRSYDRTIELPGQAVADSVRRTFVNGILEVTLDRADKCSGDKHI